MRPVRPDLRDPGLGWVVGVALLVRLAMAVAVHRDPVGLSDPLIYRRMAEGLADGQGLTSYFGEPTAYFPPGFPFFLGGVEWVTDLVGLDGRLPLLASLAHAVLGAVAAGAVFVVARRLGGPRVGLAAGLVFALWPNLVVYTSTLLSEPLFLAFFTVALAGLVTMFDVDDAAGDGGRVMITSRAACAAIGLGAATLVRPQVVLIAPAVLLAWWIGRAPRARVIRGAAVMAVGVVVFVAPWTVRNWAVFDAFVPISTNGGDNLCVGFHDGADGTFSMPAVCDTGEFYVDGPDAELRRNRETRRLGVEWITSHIAELPALSVRKLYETYRADIDGLRAIENFEADPFLADRTRTVTRVVANVAYAAIMAGALVGAVLAVRRGLADRRRRDPTAWVVLGTTAAMALVPVIVFGDGRFKLPATPGFAVLAGLAVASGVGALRSGRSSSDPDEDRRHPGSDVVGAELGEVHAVDP